MIEFRAHRVHINGRYHFVHNICKIYKCIKKVLTQICLYSFSCIFFKKFAIHIWGTLLFRYYTNLSRWSILWYIFLESVIISLLNCWKMIVYYCHFHKNYFFNLIFLFIKWWTDIPKRTKSIVTIRIKIKIITVGII